MNLPTFRLAVLAGIFFITPGFAVVNIDYVPVGHAGNAADATFDPTGYGAVAYAYQIGKYEVTNTQNLVLAQASASVSFHP